MERVDNGWDKDGGRDAAQDLKKQGLVNVFLEEIEIGEVERGWQKVDGKGVFDSCCSDFP